MKCLYFTEIALYALDVYYNKTYGFGGGGGYGYASDDYYDRYDSGEFLYKPPPRYRDPFIDTFKKKRSIVSGAPVYGFDRILRWIELAQET